MQPPKSLGFRTLHEGLRSPKNSRSSPETLCLTVNSDRIWWLWSCQKWCIFTKKNTSTVSTLNFLLQLDLRLEAFALCKAKMAVHVSIWGTKSKFISCSHYKTWTKSWVTTNRRPTCLAKEAEKLWICCLNCKNCQILRFRKSSRNPNCPP